MKTHRPRLLLLAVVLVLTEAGLYRWLAAGSTLQGATDPTSTTVSGLPRLVELGSDSCASCIAMQQVLAELRARPSRLKCRSIPNRQLALLHQNLMKYGTIYNTVAAATDLTGTIRRADRQTTAAESQ